MENPFIFGKSVDKTYFTDRKEDTKRLKTNLTHGINTILISPRRWGKTSLVKKVISEIDKSEIRPVFIDIFQCKSEYEFYRLLATEIIKQTSTKFEQWIDVAKTFLSGLSPKFTFGADPINDFSLSFDWDEPENLSKDVLLLPEKIAQKTGFRILLCIDEFQQIGEFNNSLTFQKRLRSVWQHCENVTFCMFGSKKHLLDNIFNNKSMPFYKFGDMMFLKKIPTEEWIPFICNKFASTNKTISPEFAEKICLLVDNVSTYVQHLSRIVWYKSGDSVKNSDIESAVDDLLELNTVFFQREIESLTEYQLNFLKAIADGVNTGFSRAEIISRYKLESSPNVQVIKRALQKKDLIDISGKFITFDDPILKLWIQRNM